MKKEKKVKKSKNEKRLDRFIVLAAIAAGAVLAFLEKKQEPDASALEKTLDTVVSSFL